jgi:CDP-glucose 4,6-dehydratase
MRESDLKNCFGGIYAGKRVLVTGHTGFKGSWLCEWLLRMGAKVTGLALAPPTSPTLFDQLELIGRVRHYVGDIRDISIVKQVVGDVRPHFVFHLAAQPLVRLSYKQPIETYATNVMGTAHMLEALRLCQTELPPVCAAVMITTDKCYENKEWVHSYREEDPVGGHDPYSSSKGAAELIISAYRRSFFSVTTKSELQNSRLGKQRQQPQVRIASARAGNVVGGGDWALDRILPDCIRALQRMEAIPIRNKIATRPWQHVLEPLSGYLWLGACLAQPKRSLGNLAVVSGAKRQHNGVSLTAIASQLTGPYNFGPSLESNRTVADLVEEILKHWPGKYIDRSDSEGVHEATRLNLSIDKAYHILGWRPTWGFSRTVQETVHWYRTVSLLSPNNVAAITKSQIATYVKDARRQHSQWT